MMKGKQLHRFMLYGTTVMLRLELLLQGTFLLQSPFGERKSEREILYSYDSRVFQVLHPTLHSDPTSHLCTEPRHADTQRHCDPHTLSKLIEDDS